MPIITNIEDLRQLARRKVPRAIFDYVDRGSYDEISYRANTEDLKAIRFRQRVLIDADNRSLETTMLGEQVAMPVAIAPTGLTGLMHGDGEMSGGARGRESRHPLHALHHVDLLDRGRALGDQGAILVSALRLPRPWLSRIGD